MLKKKLNKSQRKFVAKEKARIRKQFFEIEKQKQEIAKIAQRFLGKTEGGQDEEGERLLPLKKDKPSKLTKKQVKDKNKTRNLKSQI